MKYTLHIAYESPAKWNLCAIFKFALFFYLAYTSLYLINPSYDHVTSVSIGCSTVCSGADQRNHQSSASLVFVRGIHWWPVDSPHKGSVTRKMFPFDALLMPQWIHKIHLPTFSRVASLALDLNTTKHSKARIVNIIHGTYSTWWRHQMETFPRYWPFIGGIHLSQVDFFPHKKPVTWSFDVFFALRLNKRLGKQSRRWWFEASSCALWRHCKHPDPYPVTIVPTYVLA